MVLDGKAAMTVMGDWIEGYFRSQGAIPNKDYGWIAAPGTEDVFIWHSDSFGLPTGALHRDAALAWLKVVGSKKGQDAFNPIKGSIPARTDADKSLYGEYQQWAIDHFASDILVPSVEYGAAVPAPYLDAYDAAVTAFSKDLDEEALLEALKAAVPKLLEY
jgi:glucose/mannose transport system substrate-binding protein